jgi:hypothetical protein
MALQFGLWLQVSLQLATVYVLPVVNDRSSVPQLAPFCENTLRTRHSRIKCYALQIERAARHAMTYSTRIAIHTVVFKPCARILI